MGAGASLPISLTPGPWNTALPASHHIQTEVLVILVGDPALAGMGSRPGRDGTRHSTGPGAPLGWMNRAWEAGDKKLLQPDGPEADLSPRKVAGGTRGAKHGGILVIAPLQDLQEGRVGGEGVWELEAVQTCGSRGGALAHGAEQAHRPPTPPLCRSPSPTPTVPFPPVRCSRAEDALAGTPAPTCLLLTLHRQDVAVCGCEPPGRGRCPSHPPTPAPRPGGPEWVLEKRAAADPLMERSHVVGRLFPRVFYRLNTQVCDSPMF